VMIWIPMTAKNRLDTRLSIGFATHPYCAYAPCPPCQGAGASNLQQLW
jgi:hypothetical protein